MSDANGNDVFWRELVSRLGDVEQRRELLQAEAERRMEEGGEAPLSPDRIDAIVREVTARPLERLPGGASSPRRSSVPHLWKAAALITISLGLTAGLVTVRLWPENTKSSESLPFQEAVAILGDGGETAVRRLSSYGVVFKHVHGGVQTLQELTKEDPLRAEATAALRVLHEVATGRAGLPAGRLPARVFLDLIDIALDPERVVEERLAAVRELAHLSAAGIHVLEAMPIEGEGVAFERLRRGRELGLARLTEMLADY